MTGPAVTQDDPMLRLHYYRDTGQADEATKYEQYLRETGQYHDDTPAPQHAPIPAGPRVAPDASSALARNRPNASGDLQSTFANPGKQAAFAGTVALSHALNTAQAIPGAEAAEAGVGSLISGDPYQKALASLRGRIQRDVGPLAGPEKVAGSLALGRFLPANPVTTGAVLGGADQALAADPESLKMRAAKTAGGAAIGAGVGKVLDMGTTGIKALTSARPDVNLIQRQANRAASAKQLFDAALNEGRGHEATQAVQSFIQEPDIAQRIAGLQQLDQFKNTASDSPEMMDALYKSLSDEAKQIGKGLAATDPSKPNTGRFRLQQVTGLKSRLLNVLEQPGVKPPLTMDVPAGVHDVDPTMGRDDIAGPLRGAQRGQTLPGHETITGPMMEGTAGRARGDPYVPYVQDVPLRGSDGRLASDLSKVSTEDLDAEWRRLAEMNGGQEGAHTGVQTAGYREDYYALPRTERLGSKGREDLPDADGAVDPERLLQDNKTVSEYNRTAIVRQAREKAMARIGKELSGRAQPADDPLDTSFDFGLNAPLHGPAGPAFMLRGQPDQVTPAVPGRPSFVLKGTAPRPGVHIETPAMRVQTAPAEPQPAMMPGYRAAVEDFAKQSAGIDALGKGVKFSQAIAAPKRPTWNQITSKSPKTAASLAEWVKTASPDEIQAAREGILGDTRNALSEPSKTFKPFRQAISKNSDALRALSTPGQNMTTLLQQLGLAAGNSPFANP